jgi:hypothetical protein
MKEMEYTNTSKRELLERNTYKDHEYFVISLGTHPCGYVKLNGENPTLEDVCCHGGITYKESHLRISNEETLSGEFIGWDYAHCGDYMGYDEDWCRGVKYTTEDIVEECKRVIDELGGK